ncbi:hypothetical protein [Mycobacteroides chelonae]|uniref:hypothetical protein n=1 Tax=Mycobacteroides chelonae TaxID=1774 RepID=UPI00104283F0|nr:hypothetical protein [Mycobacteroides chelonae]
MLRNTGRVEAQGVEVDLSRIDAPLRRRIPAGETIAAGAGWDFMLKGSWSASVPAQLFIRWAGQEDWVAVPMPSAGVED